MTAGDANPSSGQAPAAAAFALRRHWTQTWRGGLSLALLSLLATLPGIGALPPIDRDEARFAEASRRMLADGDFLVPQVEDEPRLNKPPLIYWLQSAAVRLTGGTPPADGGIWAYRLPSVLGAVLAALFTWRLGRRMFAPPVGWLAGALLGVCLVVLVDSRQARVDQVLLALTTLAQLALFVLWQADRATLAARLGWATVLWLALGLGILTKGPITPLVVGLTTLTLCLARGQWRWLLRLHPEVGAVVLTALIGPWPVLVAQRVGWETLRQVFLDEVLHRGLEAKEGHGGFPGFYLVLLPILFWPGSLALVPALRDLWRRGRFWRGRRSRDAELFCAAWLVPAWLVFELSGTRLPHYTLPLYPALALLCARGVFATRHGWRWLLASETGKVALGAWLVLTEILLVLVPVALMITGRIEPRFGVLFPAIVLLLMLQALVVLIARLLNAGRRPAALVVTLGASVLFALLNMQFVLPNLRAIWLSPQVARAISEVDPAGQRPVVAADYHEESLLFLLDGRLRRLSWSDLEAWSTAHPETLVVIVDKPWLQGEDAMADARTIASISGLNYANGRWQTLLLLERAGYAGSASRSAPPDAAADRGDR